VAGREHQYGDENGAMDGTGAHRMPGVVPAPWIGEALRVAIRWVHGLATTAWVGGSLFYLLALRPAVRVAGATPAFERAVAAQFREVVEASLVVLVVSGAILTFDRLSSGAATPLYLGILAVKIVLAIAMCWLAWELGWAGRHRVGASRSSAVRRTALTAWLAPSRLILVLGVVVMLLAVVLRQVFEANLTATGQ
jgi:uncharacterized membrane protein